jgi:hypothetical protein
MQAIDLLKCIILSQNGMGGLPNVFAFIASLQVISPKPKPKF